MEVGIARRKQSLCHLPALHQSGWLHSPQGPQMVSGLQMPPLWWWTNSSAAWLMPRDMRMVGGRNLGAVPHTQPRASEHS